MEDFGKPASLWEVVNRGLSSKESRKNKVLIIDTM